MQVNGNQIKNLKLIKQNKRWNFIIRLEIDVKNKF